MQQNDKAEISENNVTGLMLPICKPSAEESEKRCSISRRWDRANKNVGWHTWKTGSLSNEKGDGKSAEDDEKMEKLNKN